MRDIFSHGREAMRRVGMLFGSLSAAAAFNAVDDFLWQIPRWAPSFSAQKLTLAFDPSLLLLGFGSIIGLRAGLGLLAGALLAWGLAAPELIDRGVVDVAGAENWFQPLVGWLLWPGVTLMVTTSLVGFAAALLHRADNVTVRGAARGREPGQGARLGGFALAAGLAIVLQMLLFDVHWSMAVAAIPMAFALAMVAARVTGETGIPPIGAIGKVSQLSFAVMAPGKPVTNLMTANVAGGAAGQCADLLNDFRAGHLIGASPGFQVVAQCAGILTGSLVGSLVYLKLISDPERQLLTPEWPAPAVATWKAVADSLTHGLGSIPPSAMFAMAIAAVFGIVLALLERRIRGPRLVWLPSGTTLGLAFVMPAGISITLFLGALLAAILHRFAPHWSARFLLSIAAGLVAGESLYGVIRVWF
jgi:uncharacterized oligopeptide transporter (OPT) family protein